MKEIAVILISFALLLGITALAVERFDDRELFVSPPDAVAEGFTREIMTGRYDRARPYLAEPDSVTDDELRALRREGVTEVEAEIVSLTRERAEVKVRLEGEDTMRYALVFHKEWKIEWDPR